MRKRNWSRREMLGASAGTLAATLFAEPLRADAVAPSAVTPELIEAARKEGKVSYYAAIQLDVAERLGKLFEAKYPGISVRVERSGPERIFQPISKGRRTAGWRLICRKTCSNIPPPISSIPKGCTPPHAPGWRRSVTTPIW